MRRAVIFIILLAITFGVAFETYLAYNYHKSELEYNYISCEELTLHRDGSVSGKFLCEKVGRSFCAYEYYVLDGNLYITLYVTAGKKRKIETDEEGYVKFTFENVGKIEKIYYIDSKKEHSLTFDKE